MALETKLKGMYNTVKERFSPETEIDHSLYKSQNGFTIIELFIVGAVIGIMAAIAIPNMKNAIKVGKVRHCGEEINQLYKYAEQYTNEDATPTFDEFDEWLYKESGQKLPQSYRATGIAFNDHNQYTYFGPNPEEPAFVIACRDEHEDILLPEVTREKMNLPDGKVWKLYRAEGEPLMMLERGEKDWFTEHIEKNYE